MESRRMILMNPICRAAMGSPTANRVVETAGQREGRTNRKSSIEIYITMCRIDGQWEFAI